MRSSSEVRSPILVLERAIAGAAFSIAPERERELAGDSAVADFSLALVDERKFNIRVNMVTHEAKLPIATLEYLWCCAFAFYVLYKRYVHAQTEGSSCLDTAKIPELSEAVDLVNWARVNMRESGQEKWPNHLPCPVLEPDHRSDVHVANELFLCAIAWIIHHEIAHVRNKHAMLHATYSVQQEREADLHATRWVLDHCSEPVQRQKRQLGIATALMAMQLLDEPEAGNSYVGSHPPSLERLHYCLEEAQAGDDSVVCAFAAVALQFHTSQFDLKPILDGESIRDILSGFMVAFRTAGRK